MRTQRYQIAMRLAAGLTALALFGCAARRPDSLSERLENRGPVALSDENPYLAGNLLLSQKAAKSPILSGFLKLRGVPPALEVERDLMAPPRLKFYYPEAQQVYTVEDAGPDVVISGPERLTDERQRALVVLTHDMRKTPPLLSDGEPEPPAPASAPQKPETAPTAQPQTTAAPPSPPRVKKRAAAGSHEQSQPLHQAEALAENVAEDTVRRLQERGESLTAAETSPQGDVVHYVTYPGETLSMIARWYTHDRANVGRLTRLNKLKNPDALQLGDVIVIPRYLVKNKSRLTEEAIQQLQIKR